MGRAGREAGAVLAPARAGLSGLYANELGPVLAERGFRVVAPDGPGHGGSPALPRERYALPALVRIVEALLDELGWERAAFVGHSWGASIGLHVAAAAPERLTALALLDTAYDDPRNIPGHGPLTYEEQLERQRATTASWRWESWDALVDDLRGSVRELRPGFLEVVRAAVIEDGDGLRAPADPEVRAAALTALYDSWDGDAIRRLGASGLPVLLLVASAPGGTRGVPARRRGALPGAGAAGGRRADARLRPRPDRGRGAGGRGAPRRVAAALGRAQWRKLAALSASWTGSGWR